MHTRPAEDTPLTVAGPGVLANDTDIDGNPLTASLVSGTAHGALSLNDDGASPIRPRRAIAEPTALPTRHSTDSRTATSSTVTLAVSPVSPTLDQSPTRPPRKGRPSPSPRLPTTQTRIRTLTYSLGSGAPAGASIDPHTGLFSWTPTEAQGSEYLCAHGHSRRQRDPGLKRLPDLPRDGHGRLEHQCGEMRRTTALPIPSDWSGPALPTRSSSTALRLQRVRGRSSHLYRLVQQRYAGPRFLGRQPHPCRRDGLRRRSGR